MKVRVSKNLRGEIRIEGFNRTFKAGVEIVMPDEIYNTSHNQWAVSKGYLIPMVDESETANTKEPKAVRVKSNGKYPITLMSIGRAVYPNEKFFVSESQFEAADIQLAIRSGKFEILENDGIKEAEIDSALDEVVEITLKTVRKKIKRKASRKKIKKKASRKKTKRKTKKKTSKKSHINVNKDNEVILDDDTKKPTNMQVYRPKGASMNEPPSLPDKRASIIIDDNTDDEEHGEMFIESDKKGNNKENNEEVE